MYLSQWPIVFVEISKCICPQSKIYLFKLQDINQFYHQYHHHHYTHQYNQYDHRRVQGSISPSSSCSETSSGSLGSSSFQFQPNPKIGSSNFPFQPNPTTPQPQSLTQFQTRSDNSSSFGSLQHQHQPPVQPKPLLQAFNSPLNVGQWISRWVVGLLAKMHLRANPQQVVHPAPQTSTSPTPTSTSGGGQLQVRL